MVFVDYGIVVCEGIFNVKVEYQLLDGGVGIVWYIIELFMGSEMGSDVVMIRKVMYKINVVDNFC